MVASSPEILLQFFLRDSTYKSVGCDDERRFVAASSVRQYFKFLLAFANDAAVN